MSRHDLSAWSRALSATLPLIALGTPARAIKTKAISTAGRVWAAARTPVAAAAGLAIVLVTATPALADLKMCNSTSSRIGVSVGYQDDKGWATEGWWTISPQTCEPLLKGALPSQFIYIHAVDYDRGGEWAGANQMCTDDKSFVIRGVDECDKRGYKRSGFFEVNTGDAKEWTIRLTDPEPGSSKKE